MDKQKYEIKFVKPKDVVTKKFHIESPEIIIQKMTDAGYCVLKIKPIK
jgi:hypothetical protein